MTELLTKDTFFKKVFNWEENKDWKFEGEVPCVIDFYADWCGPCKMIAPSLEQIANERDITIAKVNTDANQLKMGQFGFRGIPALVLYHNGQPIDQQTGALPKAGFDDWLNRHMK